jgi:hypothetical protein
MKKQKAEMKTAKSRMATVMEQTACAIRPLRPLRPFRPLL